MLHGPPGCGKTLVARSVAAEYDAEVHEISAASVFGAYTGASHTPQHCYDAVPLMETLQSRAVYCL